MENHMGYRFQPSNEQILYLLVEKRLNPHFSHHPIKDVVDICSLEPWDLASTSVSTTESEDQVWYFFCEPYYKYRKSNRAHRRTKAGHWKITSKNSQIEARNGLTGTKKILTFYRHGLTSKEAITDWVMHEYHVKDDPSYKKEFVFSHIERKQKTKKHGTSTTDDVESHKQLVSSPQQSPSDHFSYGNLSEDQTFTIFGQQLQNQKFSYPGNLIQQNTITYPQSINAVLPPDGNLEWRPLLDHPSVTHNFAEKNFQEGYQPIEDSKSYGGYNRLNDTSFSTVRRPIYQEQELINSDSSFDNLDFSDYLIDTDEQVDYLIKSPRAFPDENSPEESGKTLPLGFNPSKSDGKASAYVVNSSHTNTAGNDTWIKELLESFLK